MVQLSKSIQNLNLDAVIMRLRRDEHMKTPAIQEAVTAYLKFLELRLSQGVDTTIAPTPQADLVWHYHILDTRQYMADCDNIFGEYMHHNPNPQEDVMQNAIRNTQKQWQKTFKEDAPQAIASAMCIN